MNYHFRSLDTWLDGVCKSCCEEHPWHSDALNYLEAAGKRSIFCQEALDEDCSAGGEDEEDQGGDELQDATPPAASEVGVEVGALASSSSADDEPVLPGSNPVATVASEAAGSVSNAVAVDTSAVSSSAKAASKKPKRVSAFSSNSAATTAASTPGAVVGASVKLNRSASKLATSAVASSTDAGKSSKSAAAVGDFSCAKSGKEGARSYYLGKTNGWKLVRAAMDKRGWTMMPTEYHFSTKYGFKWVERRNQIDYIAHVPGQLVCHIPNNDIITTKIGMLCTLRDKFCRQSAGSAARLHPPWLPHTYDLESPADCIALLQEEERLASGAGTTRKGRGAGSAVVAPPKSPAAMLGPEDGSGASIPDAPEQQSQVDDDEDELAGKVGSDITGGIWIYKPSCTNRGRGIKVITGLPALKELCYGKPMGDSETTLPYKGIVQKYIRNPLLVTSEGYKFDVRCYLLIARNSPTTLAFYHPGYCRLALKPYTIATVASLEDNCVHLTNAAIQKKDAIYKEDGNKELQV